MLRNLLVILFSILALKASAEIKEKIVKILKDTDNLNFHFEQNINGKIDNGICTIEYPKKIYCKYSKNGKLLVSNGKSLVIKTLSSYYRYPLEKTPLNLILNKSFLIDKIYDLNEKIIDQSYINYTIMDNENKIDIFFDIENFNLIGWQTNDIYQNSTLTLLSSISINKKIDKNLFTLPPQN